MVRVGIQEDIPQELLSGFPADVELVRLPQELTAPVEVEFWILPFSKAEVERLLPYMRGLKVMHATMAGVDWLIPIAPKGVTLCDGRGIHDASTSEWAVAAILGMLKWFPVYVEAQQQQQWLGQKAIGGTFVSDEVQSRGHYRVLSEDLDEKKVLIVGYGSIGAAIETRLQGFGVEIVRVARSARTSPEVHPISELDNLIPDADIVVLQTPLTAETKGLFGKKQFGLMKEGALLVNSARGPVADTEALVEALQAGKIRAALDVTDPEPLPTGHPLWSAPHCFITPHIAGSVPLFQKRAMRFIGTQLDRYLKGEELDNLVNEAGY